MKTTKAQRFAAKVALPTGPDGCWNWTANKRPNGYGVIGHRSAHRVAYEMFVGPIPDGLHIDHLCRNRGCVNPAHLEAVTPRENLLRGFGAAAQNARKTECKRGHQLSGDNLWINKRGERKCRACGRARCRQWQEENREKSREASRRWKRKAAGLPVEPMARAA